MHIDDNKILGNLCIRGHDYNGTGKSLRYKNAHRCVACDKLRAIGYTQSGRKSEIQSAYYNRNKENKLQYQREHRLKNRKRLNARDRQFYQDNKEARLSYMKGYREKNYERLYIRNKLYKLANKDRANACRRAYMQKHRDDNTPTAIGIVLRGKVRQAFIRYTKTGKIMASSKYGIDYKGIIEHLGPHPNTLGIEGKFHVDHIIPVSAFDLNDLEQVKIAFAPSNHQWLTAHENQIKAAKIPSKDIVPVELLAMLDNHNIGVFGNG